MSCKKSPYQSIERTAGIVALQNVQTSVRFPQHVKHGCHGTADCGFCDFRISVLNKQYPALLKKVQRPLELVPVKAHGPESKIDYRAVEHHLEGVRILAQGLLRFRKGHRIHSAPVLGQTLQHRLQAVVLHLMSQKHIHGHIEEIRHLYNQRQLRHRQARFPFVHRTYGDAEHLCKLLLGHFPVFAKLPYIL